MADWCVLNETSAKFSGEDRKVFRSHVLFPSPFLILFFIFFFFGRMLYSVLRIHIDCRLFSFSTKNQVAELLGLGGGGDWSKPPDLIVVCLHFASRTFCPVLLFFSPSFYFCLKKKIIIIKISFFFFFSSTSRNDLCIVYDISLCVSLCLTYFAVNIFFLAVPTHSLTAILFYARLKSIFYFLFSAHVFYNKYTNRGNKCRRIVSLLITKLILFRMFFLYSFRRENTTRYILVSYSAIECIDTRTFDFTVSSARRRATRQPNRTIC